MITHISMIHITTHTTADTLVECICSPVIMNDSELRASELPQPAPAASMLDTFGQSDRRITDDHNYDGSVPQVLALMNGNITQQLTGLSSKVVDDLDEANAVLDQSLEQHDVQ